MRESSRVLTELCVARGREGGESLHGKIAITLAREILSGGAGELRSLCRLFAVLNIPRDDQRTIKMLRFILEDVIPVHILSPLSLGPICLYLFVVWCVAHAGSSRWNGGCTWEP